MRWGWGGSRFLRIVGHFINAMASVINDQMGVFAKRTMRFVRLREPQDIAGREIAKRSSSA